MISTCTCYWGKDCARHTHHPFNKQSFQYHALSIQSFNVDGTQGGQGHVIDDIAHLRFQYKNLFNKYPRGVSSNSASWLKQRIHEERKEIISYKPASRQIVINLKSKLTQTTKRNHDIVDVPIVDVPGR